MGLAKILNDEVGELKYIDCPICKNKGHIYFTDEQSTYKEIKVKDCECLAKRKIYRNLEFCGINKELLKRYTFQNFVVEETWQEMLKEKSENYIKECSNEPKWFTIASGSGYGKTHLCTAIFVKLIKAGYDCKFMLWRDELAPIKQLKKSSAEKNMKEYDKIMTRLKTVEVLYIDDFMKLVSTYSKSDDLEIAYEIINARYNNNLITILSTEYLAEQFKDLDMAIYGRIRERCKEYFIELKKDDKRNYRLKQ